MELYINKSALVAEIEKLMNRYDSEYDENSTEVKAVKGNVCHEILCTIDSLKVKDPYEECIQYDSIKAGIQAHAETYSFNIESELFNQLTPEQQKLWRKEIEQAAISGGEVGVELARDTRYKENLEVKEVETWHLQEKEDIYDAVKDYGLYKFACIMKDGTIQRFNGSLDEDCEGHINAHIDGVNDDYDNIDDIVKWIEYT